MSSNSKVTLISVWLAALFLSGGLVFYLEVYGLFTRDGKHLASLSIAKGEVQYRPEEISSWYNVVDDQIFFEGDRVSTGLGSRAIIKFETGQELELEENSQIEIKQNKENNEVLNVTLLKGYVAASGSKKSQIVLKTVGGKEYRLTGKSDEVCISKDIGKTGNLECLKKNNKVTLKKKKFTNMAALNSSIVIKDPSIPETPDLPDAKLFLPKIFDQPRSGSIAWTTSSFRSKSTTWQVSLRPPTKKPSFGIWEPFVEILDGGGKSRNVYLDGKPKFRKQKLEIPIKQIKKVATRNTRKFPPAYDFSIRAGGKISDLENNMNQEMSSKRYNYSVRTIDEIPAGDFELGLINDEIKKGNSKWFFQRQEITLPQAKLRVSLSSKADLLKLLPFMRTGKFYLKKGDKFKNKRVFIARKMEIVASLSGKVTKSAAIKIRKMLDADFIFRGDKTSFFRAKSKTAKDFGRWVNSLLKSGGKVYVLRKNKFYPISKNFLTSRNQVMNFVGRNATYVFDK